MREATTAVARREPQAVTAIVQHGLVRDVAALRAQFESVRQAAIVLMPEINISALPPLYAAQPHAIYLSTQPADKDVYAAKFHQGGECSLTAHAINKLMLARGLSPVYSKAESPEKYLWRHDVIIKGQQLDGQLAARHGHKELDLRDGSPEAARMKPGELQNARAHGASLCQTKAMLRGVRPFLTIQSAYRLEDIASKPFVFVTLVPDLDMNDPAQKAAAIAMMTGASSALYPAAADAALPAATATVIEAPELPDDGPEQGEPVTEDDLPAPPPEPEPEPIAPPAHLCGCACGHQVEIDQGTAALTSTRLGIELCVRCVPGARFDDHAHEGITRLSFPKRKDLESIEAAVATARAARAKRSDALQRARVRD